MTQKQIKDRNNRYCRMRDHQARARGRFFYDACDMAHAKFEEAIANSHAKREGKKLIGVRQHVWGCGSGCVSTHPQEDSGATLPKQRKQPTKARSQRRTNKKQYQKALRNIGKSFYQTRNDNS